MTNKIYIKVPNNIKLPVLPGCKTESPVEFFCDFLLVCLL